MNIAVQKPTSIIIIDITRTKEKQRAQTSSHIPNMKKVKSMLDFYSLTSCEYSNGSDGEFDENIHNDGGKKRSKMGVKNNLLIKQIVDKRKDMQRDNEDFQTLLSLDNVKFIEMSLKNDIRVKSYKMLHSSIQIVFWTVEDSISFYKQYISLVKMKFAENYNLGFDFSIPSENTNSYSSEKSSGDSEIAPKEELQDIFKLKPFFDSHCEKKTDDYEIKKQEFQNRVDYFNKLKLVFSKSDYKKMEMAIEKNNRDFIFANCKEMAVGSTSNIIVQKVIKLMTDSEICELIKSFGYDIAAISATKYGAYAIQTLISGATTKASQNLISFYFEGNGRFLITHEIGNYSIQKIIRFDEELIFDFFMKDLSIILNDNLGYKVFRRCYFFFVDKKEVIKEKVKSIESLSTSPNYGAICDILNE